MSAGERPGPRFTPVGGRKASGVQMGPPLASRAHSHSSALVTERRRL